MKQLKIECPKCHRAYEVAEGFLGRKVVCANKTCGTKFVAEVSLPSPENVATTFTAADVASSQEDDTPPPLAFGHEPSRASRPKAQGRRIAESEPKTQQRQMIFLTALAAVPSVLLCVGALLYWHDISNRQSRNDLKSNKNAESSAPATTATPLTNVDPASSVGSVTALDPEYRKAVIRTLMFSNTFVRSVKRQIETNAPTIKINVSESYKWLASARNAVGAPPKSLKNGEQVEQHLDSILTDFHRAISLIEEPKVLKEFTDVAQLIAELQKVDGHGVPEPIEKALDDVTRSVDAIAHELGLSFDDAHRSDLFAETALDFLSNIRASVAKLNELPVDPPTSLLLMEVVRDSAITLDWEHITAPPERMPDRDQVLKSLLLAHNEALKAARIHGASYKFRKKLTHDDQAALRQSSDDASQNALKIADILEPVIKKSRTR